MSARRYPPEKNSVPFASWRPCSTYRSACVEPPRAVGLAGRVDTGPDREVRPGELLEDPDGVGQVVRARAVADRQPGTTEVHERVAPQLGPLDLLGQLQRSLCVLDGHGVGLRDGSQGGQLTHRPGQVGVRDGVQLEIAVLAEHRQRTLDRLAGGLGTDRPERGAGVRDEGASELVRVVLLAGHRHRRLRARQGGVEAVQQVERVGLERQQVRVPSDGQQRGMAQHGLDVPHGLAVGTGGGGLVGRGQGRR